MSLFIASSVTVISSQFFGDPIHCEIVSETLKALCLILSEFEGILPGFEGTVAHVIYFQSTDNEFHTDDSADEDVTNNYCWMFATFDIPPEMKVEALLWIHPYVCLTVLFQAYCTNRRSYFGKTNLYNTYYQWVSVYFMLQVNLNILELITSSH